MSQVPVHSVDVSVLVPARDEAENLPDFVRLCAEHLSGRDETFQVIVVNDGSVDDSAAVLDRLRRQYPFLSVVTHRTSRGIADALKSAGDVADGRVFVFYPADLQFHPEDIPDLVHPILNGDADLVTGAKQGEYEKAFVSRLYNRICRRLFGVRVTDMNAVKAYRREIMQALPVRPDWHRYMVVMAAAEGFRLAERPVKLYPRSKGKSKFGIGRIPVGVMDLLAVWFELRYGRKPLLFFGVSGALMFAAGFLVGVVALILRFGFQLGFRPLLDLVMVLVISGIALFGFGFVGEMLAGLREEQRALAQSIEDIQRRLPRSSPGDGNARGSG